MLVINQLDPKDAKRFVSSHGLVFDGLDGRVLVQLSGVVLLDYEANHVKHGLPGKARKWESQTLSLSVSLPDSIRQNRQLYVEQCTPFLTINAIGGVSTVGWAVDSFSADIDVLCDESYRVQAALGVYSSGEVLHRIGYNITVVGRYLDH